MQDSRSTGTGLGTPALGKINVGGQIPPPQTSEDDNQDTVELTNQIKHGFYSGFFDIKKLFKIKNKPFITIYVFIITFVLINLTHPC